MATLVKFMKDKDSEEVFALFPQLNYARRIFGNSMKVSYVHYGQHGACHVDYANESVKANESEYLPLRMELESIGYNLKICK